MGKDDGHRLPRSYCSPHVPAVSVHITEPLFLTALSWLWFSSTFRLAFVTLRNNLMVLSLRAMIVQFVVLMLIAAFCFGGFLYALWTWVINTYNLGTGKLADTIGTRRLSRNEAGYVICIYFVESSLTAGRSAGTRQGESSHVFQAFCVKVDHTRQPRQISWWMLDLYFGLDASGFDKSGTYTFHKL